MKTRIVLGLVLSAAMVSSASATTRFWENGSNDGRWQNAANWNAARPSISDWAVIDDTGPGTGPIVDYAGAVAYGVTWIGTNATPKVLTVNSGTFTTRAGNLVGQNAGTYGEFTVNDGNVILNNTNVTTNNLYIGKDGTGTVNFNGGTTLNHRDLYMGDTATGEGTLNIAGGSFTNNDQGFIGWGGKGTINITSGDMNVMNTGNLAFDLGGYGTGILDISGGELNIPNGRLNLAHFAGSSGHIEMSGGQIFADDYYHWAGTSSVHMTGGLMIIKDNRVGRVNVYLGNGSFTTDPGLTIVNEWDANYAWPDGLGTGAQLVYVTPEPTSLALLAIGTLPLLRRRRS